MSAAGPVPAGTVGGVAYAWTEWAVPTTGGAAWAHHGLDVDAAGRLVSWDQAARAIVLVDPDTRAVTRSIPVAGLSAHGLTASGAGSEARIWMADNGRADRLEDGHIVESYVPTSVTAYREDGSIDVVLDRPPGSTAERDHVPTAVAIAEPALGGDGSVWVADGYGSSLVHRFGRDGRHRLTLDGTSGAARFDCPHVVFVDARGDEPRLLVADRGNAIVQVFDLDGAYMGSFGAGTLNSPSAFAVVGERLIVAELRSRLAVLDEHDEPIGYLGDGGPAFEEPGWPNELEGDGPAVRAPRVRPPRFRAPHGLAATADGTILVAEWLIGGRIVELTPDR